MEVSAFDSLIPYPDSAVGYHLVYSQNPIVCDALGVPKNTTFSVTVYRKTGKDSMEVAKGVYISVEIIFPGTTRLFKSTTGKISVSLVENSFTVPKYAGSVTVWVGESSYDIHDIADFPVGFTSDGKKGNNGRLPVPYGEYSSTTTYTATDIVAPYVLCAGKYYVMNKTTSVKGLNPQTDYATNGVNATWILLENYKAIFVELLMANLGLIGKAVFYNEYQFSQYGKNGTTAVVEGGKYGIPVDAGGSFSPNLLLNFLTGYFRCNNVELTGVINAISGIFKNIVVNNSILKDVKINGTVSQPWARSGIYINIGSDEKVSYDNIASGASGGWGDGSIQNMITWTLADSGRIIRIANWKFNGETFSGTVDVTAPSGKYFFENGIQKSKLTLSREVVELIGYGDSSTFHGWIVLNRIDFMTTNRYGQDLKVLATGRVIGTNSGASISYKTYDGGTMTVSRKDTGKYLVWTPWNYGQYTVFVSGINSAYGGPIKASLESTASNAFEVHTSDDDSRNDGSFTFMMISTADWK